MSSADIKAIGAEVRRRRVEKGITQTELAKRAGLSPITIGDVERGAVDTSIMTLEHIARGLGVQPGALFPGQRGLSAAGGEFAKLFDAVDDRKVQSAVLTILRALTRKRRRS